MKINITQMFKSKYEINDKRTIKRFLWYPLSLRNCMTSDYEIRWLCYANIYQSFDYGLWYNGWNNICFDDREQKKA